MNNGATSQRLDLEPAKLLIVEDEAIVAMDIQRHLERLQYRVLPSCASAEEALDMARRERPDLVLMDIHIQGSVDGIQAASQLRSELGIPVIYLTAYADSCTLERAKLTLPLGYLIKPFRQRELRSTLEMALYKHRLDTELAVRERWLSTTLRSIGEGVIATDQRERVEFVNPVAEHLTGWSGAEARGQRLADVVRLRVNAASVRPSSASGSPVISTRASLVDKSGGEHHVTSTRAAIVDEKGGEFGQVVVLRDITEEQALRRRLETADRLASLGLVAAGVAHEINNPLAAVLANVEFVKEHLKDTQTIEQVTERALEDTIDSSRRIGKIVEELSRFARGEAARGGHSDLTRVIPWAARTAQIELKGRAAMHVDMDEDLPLVEGDETRLGQVFLNLIVNAVHAVVEASSVGHEIWLAVRSGGDEGLVRVEVRDTGVGISEQDLERIFDPFFTTKAPGSGTGLGLPLCHAIVTSLGGTIEVQSTVGRGSTFVVSLPVARVEDRVLAPLIEPAPSARGEQLGQFEGTPRVLVIDDESMMRRTIERVLGARYRVVAPASATEALAVLETDQDFDCILCDLVMPDISGADVWKKVADNWPELLVGFVFMTGGGRGLTEIERQFGTAFRLEKPFEVQTLQSVIERVMRRKKAGKG